MKKLVAAFTLVVLALGILGFAPAAFAEEKTVGVVTKITVAGDGKSAVAVLKDTKSGKQVEIVVNDDLTLDKFKDHRIVEGDEVRCKYDNAGGKNVSKYFRKTAGC